MRLTLLQYVQSILSSLDSDEVNSISDTVESMQVAEIVRASYFNLVTRTHMPDHKQLIQLEPSLDETQPVLMFIPDGIARLDWIRYYNNDIFPDSDDKDGFSHDLNLDVTGSSTSPLPAPPGYLYVEILPVRDFLDITTSFNPNETGIASFQFQDNSNNYPGNYTFYYRTDRQPAYCTVLSDFYVIFDAYDNAVDSTLQASKTMAYGEIVPFWKMEDTFIPNIDEQQVPLLLNEAKSLAFFELKQSLHTKAEQELKRQWSSVQKDKSKVDKPSYFDQLPNFGRWGRNSYASVGYFKLRGWDRP